MSIEWNSIRLGGLAMEIMTKTVHKTPPRGDGGPGVVESGWGGGWGLGVVESMGWDF